MPLDEHLSQPSQPIFEWRFVCYSGSKYAWKTWALFAISVFTSAFNVFCTWLFPFYRLTDHLGFLIFLGILQVTFLFFMMLMPLLLGLFIAMSRFYYDKPNIVVPRWIKNMLESLGEIYTNITFIWYFILLMVCHIIFDSSGTSSHGSNGSLSMSLLMFLLSMCFLLVMFIHIMIAQLLNLGTNFINYSNA